METIQEKPYVMSTTNLETGETIQTYLSESEVITLLNPVAKKVDMQTILSSMHGDYGHHWCVPEESLDKVAKILRPSPLKRFNIFNWFK